MCQTPQSYCCKNIMTVIWDEICSNKQTSGPTTAPCTGCRSLQWSEHYSMIQSTFLSEWKMVEDDDNGFMNFVWGRTVREKTASSATWRCRLQTSTRRHCQWPPTACSSSQFKQKRWTIQLKGFMRILWEFCSFLGFLPARGFDPIVATLIQRFNWGSGCLDE